MQAVARADHLDDLPRLDALGRFDPGNRLVQIVVVAVAGLGDDPRDVVSLEGVEQRLFGHGDADAQILEHRVGLGLFLRHALQCHADEFTNLQEIPR